MKKESAGILVFRIINGTPEFLLVHPGGPYWQSKDNGAWSIPKGEVGSEAPLETAKREFSEETGIRIEGNFISLDPVVQKGGKKVHAFMIEKNLEPCFIKSNEFEMEWPPRSGKKIFVPEVDKACYFTAEEAKKKINPAQFSFILQCLNKINKCP